MAIKKFRVFVDVENRWFSKPMNAENMEARLEKFKEHGCELRSEFEHDDDVYEEPVMNDYGGEELIYEDEAAIEDNEYEINDEIYIKS